MSRRSLVPLLLSDWPELSEEIESLTPYSWHSSGVSISEDEEAVYVDVALPGISPKDVEVTYDQGVLFVKGSKEETKEDKKRKYYRKAASAFSYRLNIPVEVNEEQEPEATFERGMMKIRFKKKKRIEPKKIKIKEVE